MFPYLLIKDMVLMRDKSSGEVNDCVHGERNQRIESKGKAYTLLTNWQMQRRRKQEDSIISAEKHVNGDAKGMEKQARSKTTKEA